MSSFTSTECLAVYPKPGCRHWPVWCCVPHSTDSPAMCNTLAGGWGFEFCQPQTLILCQVGLVAAIPHPTDLLVMCNTLAGVLAANPDLKSRIVNSLLQSGVLSVH